MTAEQTGHKIAYLRREKGLTQRELAQALHITDKAVSKWERGLNYPDISLLEPLAQTLGSNVPALLGLEESEGEKVADALAQLSGEERQCLLREFRLRGWITVVLGLLTLTAALYVSYILAQHQIFGLSQAATAGLSGFLGLLIGNGLFIVRKSHLL